jgi:4-hydroxythreonine-4-phosphate dehydrogenase
MHNEEKPIIGISIGDYNGIGPEVIIKSLMDSRILKMVNLIVYGSTKVLSYYSKNFRLDSFSCTKIPNAQSMNPRKINVINCWDHNVEIKAGSVSEEAGRAAFFALKRATEDLKEGQIQCLVTGPINKKNIQNEEFNFHGQTEYFTERFDLSDSLMMMVSSNLKVGVVTGHIPLSQVSENITEARIRNKIKIFSKSLRNDFGIQKPKIALLGLNPHAGEEGILGNEEEEVIKPTIKQLKDEGNLLYGPYAADGFFGSGLFRKFDGILAMYHDQGLIPFKTLAFENGINYTAGLPIVRTSPDHGTAYDIAGKNIADETSIREAIFLATDIYRARRESHNIQPVAVQSTP